MVYFIIHVLQIKNNYLGTPIYNNINLSASGMLYVFYPNIKIIGMGLMSVNSKRVLKDIIRGKVKIQEKSLELSFLMFPPLFFFVCIFCRPAGISNPLLLIQTNMNFSFYSFSSKPAGWGTHTKEWNFVSPKWLQSILEQCVSCQCQRDYVCPCAFRKYVLWEIQRPNVESYQSRIHEKCAMKYVGF